MDLPRKLHNEDKLPDSGRRTLASFLHIVAIVTASVLLVFCAVACIAGVGNAIQSVEKYQHHWAEDAEKLGNGGDFLYFLYYLRTDGFVEVLLLLGLILLEFVLYLSYHRRARMKRPFLRALWILGAIMALHTAVFVHSRLIPTPNRLLEDWLLLDEVLLLYCGMANMTIFPSILYFFSYLCCSRVHCSAGENSKRTD